jgi:putative ABC transport system permease protein
MDTLFQDIRYSLRALLKNPVFTIVSLLVLSVGIGANSAIFSVVNGVLLRPLPYRAPERLVMVWGSQEKKGKDTVVPADYLEWRKLNTTFSSIAGYGLLSSNMTGGDTPERVDGLSVSGNFFSTLGVKPLVGRAFEDDPASAERDVVILGYPLWKQRFGGDPGIVGKKILLNGKPYSVVGVMPANFKFHEQSDLWMRAPRDVAEMPIDIGVDPATMRGLSYMRAIGRLKDGVSPQQAQADMDRIARQQAQQFPDTNGKRGVMLVPLQEEVVGNVDKALIVLLLAVSLVLLIACTNVANLFFARASDRQREITLRIALGANRLRLLRQLLTESVLLSLLAGVLGLVFAFFGTKVLVRLSPGDIPRLDEIQLDGRVLAFTLGVSLLTGLLCGLLPLFQMRRFDLAGTLKESGTKATEGVWRRRTRGMLVVAEVALAMVLLLGAGLMIRSFAGLREVKPGFDPAHVLTFQTALPRTQYPQDAQQVAFFNRVLDRVRGLPGVTSAGVVLNPPVGGESTNLSFDVEGRPRPKGEAKSRDGFESVSDGYFETLRIPLRQGRTFNSSDNAASPKVVIVSEAMVKRYWGDQNPIGTRISFGRADNPNRTWWTVVGVVADVRQEGPGAAPSAETYAPFGQWPWPGMAFVVRAQGDPLSLVDPVRRVVQEVDAAQPITQVHTMDDLLSGSVARPRFTSVLLGVFAGIALLLAAIGLYGVMAYAVSQRTPEIGIKMALGAQKGRVMGEVLRYGLLLTAIGIGLGLVVAQPLMGLIKSLLFGVAVNDRGTLFVVPLVLLITALLATFFPAWRAARIDPLRAIKQD